MTGRAEAAIAALRAQSRELERVVRTLSDAEWQRICLDEGWPVGLVAFHIARGFQRQAEFVENARYGGSPHQFDWDETHALNATVAAAHPAPEREEVLALAKVNVDRMEQALRAMSDGEVARVAWQHEGRDRDVIWIVGTLASRHAHTHLDSIAATVG